MRLVFVTRKVDRGDPLTGFIFTWLTKLARELDKLYVVCQEKSDTSGLPDNIEVYSFGKERGFSRLRQGYELLVMSFKFGKNADGFFLHMHPVYAMLAWLPAKIFNKKIVLWYTHKSVDFKLRVAHVLVDEVLTASKESFRLPSKKVKIVGHGIDLDKFKIQNEKIKNTNQNSKFKILSIGRISPVKGHETLIKAVEILVNHKNIKDLEVEIYGKIGLPEHQEYLDSLIIFVHNADLEDHVKFEGEVNYEYVAELYQEADVFVNLSQTGSIDKTVLEAAASSTLVLTSNEAFAIPVSQISPLLFFESGNPQDLAEKIFKLRSLSPQERDNLGKKLHAWVEEDHNLNNLVQRITDEFK